MYSIDESCFRICSLFEFEQDKDVKNENEVEDARYPNLVEKNSNAHEEHDRRNKKCPENDTAIIYGRRRVDTPYVRERPRVFVKEENEQRKESLENDENGTPWTDYEHDIDELFHVDIVV